MLPHRLHRAILVTFAVGSAALAVTGCGSDSSDNSSGSSTPPPAAAPTSTTPAATPTETTSTETNATGGATAGSTPVAIDMVGLKFAPEGATVKVGDTVTWTNQDDVPHNVVASDGSFKSPNFGKGETFTWTATKAGTISYTCTLHPGMNGTLNVEA